MYKSIIVLINGTRIIGFHETKEDAENTIRLSQNNQVKECKIKKIKID